MESKRQYQEEGDEGGVQTLAHHSKRRREDSQQSDSPRTSRSRLNIWNININDIVPHMKDLVQKVVREELDRKLSPRLISNETGTREAKFFWLVFENEMPASIFTLSKIKSKDDTPLEVALYDIRSQSRVADGRLSSIKVEICVLNSEFGSDGSEDWSADEFKANTMLQRANKGELLKGDIFIKLKDGVGYIPNNVVFTDNSSWTRSGRFRLGAKVVQSTNLNEAYIREGISKPFVVRDCRANQKHFPPFLGDELWRLKYIAKDGVIHQRLTVQGINTVGDLLQLHGNNPSSLKKIFGKIPKKRQEAIIEHAKTSVADGQNCIFSQNILNSHEKGLEVPIETTSIQTAQYSAPDQGLQQPYNNLLIPQQEEISGQMMPLNCSTEGQFDPAASAYDYVDEYICGNIIWPVSESQIN